MSIVRTTIKGQVVIPAEIRKKYKITKGTQVSIEDIDGEIIIKPLPADPVRRGKGLFKNGPSALKALIKDRELESKK